MTVNVIQQAISFLKESDIKGAIVSIFDNTGIAGFRFNVPKMEQVKLSNDITDYYSDSNNVFNDHIAHKPKIVTVGGLQGEYFYSVHEIKDMISTVGTTMKLVSAFKPQFDAIQKQLRTKWNNYQKQNAATALQKNKNYNWTDPSSYNKLTLKDKAQNLFNQFSTYDGIDLFNLFQELYKFKSAQTRAYLFFETMRIADKPFTVETRWKRFDKMYIQDVVVTGEDSADISDFQVTFKQMSFTHTQAVKINAAGRTQQQYWEETNKGLDKGTKVETIKTKSADELIAQSRRTMNAMGYSYINGEYVQTWHN